MANYQKSVAIEEELTKADPANAELRSNLAESIGKVSELKIKLGDRESALKGYLKMEVIYKELISLDKDASKNPTYTIAWEHFMNHRRKVSDALKIVGSNQILSTKP